MQQSLSYRTFFLLGIAGSVLVLSMCSGGGRGTPLPQRQVPSTIVEMTGTGFSPMNLTVPVHTTICWVNRGKQARSPAAVVPKGSTEAPDFAAPRKIAEGEIWCFPFPETGAWQYHDQTNEFWKGMITVVAPDAGS